MKIRQASIEDLPVIVQTLKHGKQIQLDSGNPYQWDDDYPNEDVVEADIGKGYTYVVVDKADQILATFCLMTEAEPTYAVIDGAWLNDKPYVTIHRIATNGRVKGAGRFAMEWVVRRYEQVRIDTHQANRSMLRLIEDYGFTYCGQVVVRNNGIRMAFQRDRLYVGDSD